MKQLVAHPYAALLPLMSSNELETLQDDILFNGQRDPVMLYQGKILDGRNRNICCSKLNRETTTTVFKGTDEEALQYVYSKAVHRNMSESQKACAAANFLPYLEKLAAERQRASLKQNKSAARPGTTTQTGRARDLAGYRFGVSGRYVEDARVLRENDETLFAEVMSGSKPLTRAIRIYKRAHRVAEQKRKLKHVRRAMPSLCDLQCGDALKLMEQMPDAIYRLIFWDPPYNLGFKYDGDPTRDRRADYLAWIESIARRLVDLLKVDGSLWVMICEEWVGEFLVMLKRLGLNVRRLVVWHETFGQAATNNFGRTNRYLIYATLSPDNFIFNFDALSTKSKRATVYNDKRANPDGKTLDAVWEISRLCGTFNERLPDEGIPTQLPRKLLDLIVAGCSEPGDVVFDPMFGSGTTARSCVALDRRFVGCERSKRYVEIAKRELAAMAAEGKG